MKLDGIKDFTKKNESRFDKIQLFINELRETFEDFQCCANKTSRTIKNNIQPDKLPWRKD
jgi:hypothetical protein